MSQVNVKRKKQMFILCYVPFMIALFLEDMAFKTGNIAPIVKAIKATVVVLLVLSVVGKSWKKKGFAWVVFGVLCGALTLLLTGDFFWFIVILIADVFCDVDEKVIYNVSMQTIVGMTSLTLVLCALGILSDCLTYRTDFSTEARHSLGFVHSACLPLIVFYMMTYCISTNRNMKKIGVLSLIGIVLYSICKSRNAVVITVGLSMLALLLRDKRIKSKIKKPLNLVSSLIVFVCIVFSILPGYLRYKGILLNYWYAFDQIFTNRSMLAASAFQSYGIPIVNTMNYNAYTNTPVYIDGYMNNGVVLDSAYMYMVVRYGIAMLLFLWMVLHAYQKKPNISMMEKAAFIAVVVANTIDNDLLSYECLPFIIIGIRNLPKIKCKLRIGKERN